METTSSALISAIASLSQSVDCAGKRNIYQKPPCRASVNYPECALALIAAESFLLCIQGSTIDDIIRFAPDLSVTNNTLRISVLGYSDSTRTLGGNSDVCSRRYSIRCEQITPELDLATVRWTVGAETGVIYVDTLAASRVTFEPQRIIVRDSTKQTVEVVLQFPDETYSAQLLRYPDYVTPKDASALLSHIHPTQGLAVAPSARTPSIGHVVFQVFRGGKASAEVSVPIICLAAPQKKGA